MYRRLRFPLRIILFVIITMNINPSLLAGTCPANCSHVRVRLIDIYTIGASAWYSSCDPNNPGPWRSSAGYHIDDVEDFCAASNAQIKIGQWGQISNYLTLEPSDVRPGELKITCYGGLVKGAQMWTTCILGWDEELAKKRKLK